MSITRTDFERYIKNFQFRELFNELGWDHVVKKQTVAVKDDVFELEAVAHKKDFLVFICSSNLDSRMPDANARKKIDREINKLFFEHLLIFIDPAKTKQIWQLSVKESNRPVVIRETTYHVNQNPELLYQKLSGLLFTFDEEGKIGLVDVVKRVSESFNVNAEKVTKKFYDRFKKEHSKFRQFIQGIEDTVDRDWYTSLMLNRLMFIYFIQKKGFLDENQNYVRDKLKVTQEKKGKDRFYSFYKDFLRVLFHKGLGAPDNLRTAETLQEIGRVPYLNGGLFEVHQIEETYAYIAIPDEAFEYIFDFFDEYNWHLDTRETASGKDINPDVIGYIFEKYINERAAMGAYYTKEDITDYISKNCIIPFLFEETKKECANAFRPDSSLCQMLRENPDRYIYDAVKYGIWKVTPGDPECPDGVERKLPPEIAEGLDVSKPNLLERRKAWNRSAPSEYALPTEIWREVVERRKRYFDIRKKIENGEINHINDFITYNLNIRQFAQDAIEQYEGSDFVNAFYKAITRITVLDPACGSGAFLFAALNVLEPLYEACISRMQGFVEEDDEHGGRKFPQFRKVLDEVKNHPKLKYYIYKSIILSNLYGVDIMKEAVEIAKLRLFLKLMAEVEHIDDVEPMPDIDYNIRAGNSLVGFATYEDLRKAIAGKGQAKLDLDDVSEKFKEQADIVGRAYKRFKEIQLDVDQNQDATNHQSFKKAKNELEQRLRELNKELDGYLANTYRVDPANKAKFAAWKQSHQPFHWFAEFYEIVHENLGFDAVIGNPPYVEYSKVKKSYKINGYTTEKCGNIYAYFFEKSLLLRSQKGKLGLIIPLSLVSTERMNSLQNLLASDNLRTWLSSYDVYPQKLFVGAKQRLTICISMSKFHETPIQSTKYQRWRPEERDRLFEEIEYFDSCLNENLSTIPKMGKKLCAEIYRKMSDFHAARYLNRGAEPSFYVHRIPYNYVKAFDFTPFFWNEVDGEKKSEDYKPYFIHEKEFEKAVLAALNSNLFFLWWYVLFEGYHCGKHEIHTFPIGIDVMSHETRKILGELAVRLMDDVRNNAERKSAFYKTTGEVQYEEFYPRKSKHIIDKIDKVLAQHYGLTEKELDFIINYDIKYRMGKELTTV